MNVANKQKCGHPAHQPCWDKDNTCLLSNKGIYINIRMKKGKAGHNTCLFVQIWKRKERTGAELWPPTERRWEGEGQLEWAFWGVLGKK